jgi:hypothetical protein
MVRVVSARDWEEITLRAVAAAKQGDHKARDWLSRHLLGPEPCAIRELAQELRELEAQVQERREVQGNRALRFAVKQPVDADEAPAGAPETGNGFCHREDSRPVANGCTDATEAPAYYNTQAEANGAALVDIAPLFE